MVNAPRSRQSKDMPHKIRRLLIPLCAYVLLALPLSVQANGSYSHIHISKLAVEKLPTGTLRTLLEDPANIAAYEAGSMFPDSGYAIGDNYGENAHWSPFLNAYVTYLRDKYAGDYSSMSAQTEVAFLMGIASHGIADQTYDTSILARAFEVDGNPGLADQEADYFIVVDQNVLLFTEAWAPYSDLVTVFSTGIGYSVTEAIITSGMDAMAAVIEIQRVTALQQYITAWQHYPWLGTHVYNEEAPGSLPHLAELVQRHWQVLWRRLQFNEDFDQDAVISFVPEQWQAAFPVDDSVGTANFRIGVLFGYGISRAQASPFIDLLDEADNSVPFTLQTPYNGDIRNYMFLVPSSALMYDHEYRVIVGAGVENLNGGATTVDSVLAFRTQCAAPGAGCAEIPAPLLTGPTPFSSECGVADGRDRICKQILEAGKGSLKIKNSADDSKDAIVFKWTRGEATSPAEFGNPFTTTPQSICIWAGPEESTMTSAIEATLPPGGECVGKPCWKSMNFGYRYKDKAATHQGITGLSLKGGVADKARLSVKAKGAGIGGGPLPLLPASGKARVQIRNEEACWEANFSSTIKKNDSSSFLGKSD